MDKIDLLINQTKDLARKIENNSLLTFNVDKKVAGIEEHLKSLNGSVARHERGIKELEDRQISTQLSLAKIMGLGGISGGLTGTLAYFTSGIIATVIKSLIN